MNFSTLVSSVVVSLVLTASANAQWVGGGSGVNIGVGGSYSRATLPNGKTVTSNNVNWGIGLGSSSYYGGGYGGMGYGGMGYGGMGWGGMGYYGGPIVMPYYGGGCAPVVVPYSPFTGTYANPCYAPQVIAPASFCPQAPVCW